MILVILGVTILVLTRLEQINTSAILLIKNPVFWQRSYWMDDIDNMISILPKDSSVATQNNIAPHISSRKSVFLLKDMDKAEYILADFHLGQSDYNFFDKDQKEKNESALKYKISSGKYKILYQNLDAYLIKKK